MEHYGPKLRRILLSQLFVKIVSLPAGTEILKEDSIQLLQSRGTPGRYIILSRPLSRAYHLPLVFLTGGLPPLVKQPDGIYERLYSTLIPHYGKCRKLIESRKGSRPKL